MGKVIFMQTNWQRNTYLMAFCVFCTSSSYTMLIPFLPIYLLELGTPEESVTMWASAVFSVTFFIATFMAPVWGRLADKYGRKKMAVRASACLTITYAVGGLVTGPWGLLGMRVLQGFANGFVPAVQAIVATIAPRKELGVAIGTVQTGQIIGSVMGPLLGGIMAHLVGMRLSFFLAAGFLTISTLIVTLCVKMPAPRPNATAKANTISTSAANAPADQPAPVPDTASHPSTLHLLHAIVRGIADDCRYALTNRLLMLMLLLTVTVSCANMVLQPVISLYVAQLQGTMTDVVMHAGIVFSLGGIAGAISARPWGRFGQTRGYARAMSLAFLGGGACLFMQYFPTELYGFAALQFFFGLAMAGTLPAINATMVQATPENFRGRVFGLSSSAHQTGAMVGPLLGGTLSTALGIRPIFLITGTSLLLLGALLWHRFVADGHTTELPQ